MSEFLVDQKAERSDVWREAIKNRKFGTFVCKFCAGDFEKTGARSIYCSDCRTLYRKQWAKDNPDKISKYRSSGDKDLAAVRSREWYLNNTEKVKASSARRRERLKQDDPDGLRAYQRDARKRIRDRDREADRKYRREYAAKKRSSDPAFKLNDIMSKAIRRGLKSGKAGKSWRDLVAYSVEDLKLHLENQFSPGMSWENHGRGDGCWHIDHKVPLSAHNFSSPDHFDFKRAWALDNLQPMWEFDNLSKNAKVDAPFQPSLALSCG